MRSVWTVQQYFIIARERRKRERERKKERVRLTAYVRHLLSGYTFFFLPHAFRRIFHATLLCSPAPGISILKRKKDSISREVSAPINHPSPWPCVRSALGRESSLACAARTGAPDRDDDAKMAVRVRGGGKDRTTGREKEREQGSKSKRGRGWSQRERERLCRVTED